MKERPILFSAPMVRAILAGRKTQTRRLLRQRPGAYLGRRSDERDLDEHGAIAIAMQDGSVIRCPYGAPGDRLWVREVFAPNDPESGYVYREDWGDHTWGALGPPKWTSPIFMKRSASRITLEVVSACVERLHDISEDDACREGVWGVWDYDKHPMRIERSAREVFSDLWDQINGKRAPWKSNPWVWRVEFKRIEAARG